MPEYGRDHTVLKHEAACAEAVRRGRPAPSLETLVWHADDFGFIAQRQNTLEEAAARRGAPVLVCDTDALATRVWERRYVAQTPEPQPMRYPSFLRGRSTCSPTTRACPSSRTDGATGSTYARR